MTVAYTLGRIVDAYGAAYTIRKASPGAGANSWTQGAATISYAPCKGRERLHRARSLAGGMTEGLRLIVVDAATCATEPRKGDRIALGAFSSDAGAEWLQIVNVYPAREGASVRAWRLEVST